MSAEQETSGEDEAASESVENRDGEGSTTGCCCCGDTWILSGEAETTAMVGSGRVG